MKNTLYISIVFGLTSMCSNAQSYEIVSGGFSSSPSGTPLYTFEYEATGGTSWTIQSTEDLSQPVWATETTVFSSGPPFVTQEEYSVIVDDFEPDSKFFRIVTGTLPSAYDNVVGYVKVPVFSGLNFITRPIGGGSDDVADVFNESPYGTVIYKWNGSSYVSAARTPAGWNASFDVNVGESVWLDHPLSTSARYPDYVRFHGAIEFGNHSTTLSSGLNFTGQMLPGAGYVGVLGYNKNEGDVIYKWNRSAGSYDSYVYQYDFTLGHPVWQPSLPVVDYVGEGLIINASTATTWDDYLAP